MKRVLTRFSFALPSPMLDKFNISIQSVGVPLFLAAGKEGEVPYIWATVDQEGEKRPHKLGVCVNERMIPRHARFIGRIPLQQVTLHVFEETKS